MCICICRYAQAAQVTGGVPLAFWDWLRKDKPLEFSLMLPSSNDQYCWYPHSNKCRWLFSWMLPSNPSFCIGKVHVPAGRLVWEIILGVGGGWWWWKEIMGQQVVNGIHSITHHNCYLYTYVYTHRHVNCNVMHNETATISLYVYP